MVALLLLVPGLSVSLLGRVQGETMRHLVLGRAQRLAYLSLVPPVFTAAVLGMVFGGPPQTPTAADMPLTDVPLTVERLLLLTSVVSLGISALVGRERFRGWGKFNFRTKAMGFITYANQLPSDGYDNEPFKTSIKTERVLELVKPALFQIERPSQRFMVWIAPTEDAPSTFRKVLDELEQLPKNLAVIRDDLNAEAGPLTGRARVHPGSAG
jgi:hypothetical protein